jgi:hypothetical protein
MRRKIRDLAASRALGMQMLGAMVSGCRMIDEVVRRETTVEVDVAQHTRARQALQRSIDRRPVDRRFGVSDLLEQRICRQVLPACGNDAGEQRDPRLGHALTSGTQQRSRLRDQRLVVTAPSHAFSLHRLEARG